MIVAGVAVLGVVFVIAAGRLNRESDEASEREVRRILDADWDRAVARLLNEEPWEGKN